MRDDLVVSVPTAPRPVAFLRFRALSRLYWEIAVRGYRRYASYRVATLAGIFTNTIFGFMRAYVLIALFSARPHAGGYTEADALTYTWLTQGLLMTIYIWGWYDIAERIRAGDIVSDFQRPVDFQGYWLAQDLGRAAYHFIFRGIPPFVVGLLAFSLFLPRDGLTYLLFLVSVVLATSLSFAMRFIVNIAAFWLLDYRGVVGLVSILWTFLSGSIIPLALFPGIWRTIAEALPFAGMIQTPVDIFLQQQHGLALALLLGQQLLWTILLLLFGRWLLGKARRRLVVQGG